MRRGYESSDKQVSELNAPPTGPAPSASAPAASRAAAEAQAAVAWMAWDDSSAEPFRVMARYGFIAGYLKARGFDE